MGQDDTGEKIRKLRKANGDSLRALSDKIDSDSSNLSKLERGHREVTVEVLKKIIKVYNVDPSYFFNDGQRQVIDGVEATTEEVAEAVKLIRFLRPKG